MERLQKLIDLFEGSDNIYILSELKLIKTEMEIELLKKHISILNSDIMDLKSKFNDLIE